MAAPVGRIVIISPTATHTRIGGRGGGTSSGVELLYLKMEHSAGDVECDSEGDPLEPSMFARSSWSAADQKAWSDAQESADKQGTDATGCHIVHVDRVSRFSRSPTPRPSPLDPRLSTLDPRPSTLSLLSLLDPRPSTLDFAPRPSPLAP